MCRESFWREYQGSADTQRCLSPFWRPIIRWACSLPPSGLLPLEVGANSMQRQMGVPSAIVNILVGLIVLLILGRELFNRKRKGKTMLEQILTVGFGDSLSDGLRKNGGAPDLRRTGETISEKAGILNIGMEGVMLGGAFSFAGTFYSGSLAVGLLCGMAGGAMVSAIHGLLSIRLAQDQSVSGIAINIFMAGVTSFL